MRSSLEIGFYSYRMRFRKSEKMLFKMALRISGAKLLMWNSLQGSVAVRPYFSLSVCCSTTCFCWCSCFQAVLPPPPPYISLNPRLTGRLRTYSKNSVGRHNIGSSIHGVNRVPPHQKKISSQDVLRASQKAYLGRLDSCTLVYTAYLNKKVRT